MKRDLIQPIGETSVIAAASILVVAPHYDDEVLGCGGAIVGSIDAGAVVRVLFLSDGSGGVETIDDRAAYAQRRFAESRRALKILGVSGADDLGLPDGSLERHLEPIAGAIERALLTQRPDVVLAPSPCEASADHRAAFLALHRALARVRNDQALDPVVRGLTVYFYEVNHPLYPSLLVDVSAAMPRLERAMAAYESQEERHPYWRAGRGLRAYRALSLGPAAGAVEAYRRVEAVEFRHVGPRRMIQEHGGLDFESAIESGVRVSVIVRTRNRPQLLAEALQSLDASSHRSLECIVVNDGGQPPVLPALGIELRRVDLAENRGRAAAANAGIAAATGEYLAFLDDDDLVEPDHFEVLLGMAQGTGSRVCYSDAAVGVYEATEQGWSRVERRLPYSRDFDPERLAVDNYIPFNTVLIERALALEVGPVDEALPFFEDWDFLLRLAERASFLHLPRVTCEYRHFRLGGHHVLGERPRERGDFVTMKARVLTKHAALMSSERLARVVDGLRAEEVAAREAADREAEARHRETEARHRVNGELVALRREAARIAAEAVEQGEAAAREQAELRQQIEKRDSQIEARGRQMEARDQELQRLYDEEVALRAVVEDQTQHLGRVYAEIERLQGVIRAMESTRAWRFQRWLESRRRS